MKFTLLKLVLCLGSFLSLHSCQSEPKKDASPPDPTQVEAVLDAMNRAAAEADFETYFSHFSSQASFLGTDATEVWDINTFKEWSRPYFEKKQTWDFTAVQRSIYFSPQGDIAWFEETLSTSMKLCRGSGVLALENGNWKIRQYVLSMTIPNSAIDQVISLKAAEEDSLLNVMRARSN